MERAINKVNLNTEHLQKGVAVCQDSGSASAFSIEKTRLTADYRYSRVLGIEAFMRWSLPRAALWPRHDYSFIMFTVSERCVHLTVTEVAAGAMEIHQWVLSPETRLEQVASMIKKYVRIRDCRYIFTPGRVHGLPKGHLGASLVRSPLLNYFPGAKIVHLQGLERLSRNLIVRRIGMDTRRHVAAFSSNACMANDLDGSKDTLTLSVEADCAAILKLIVTPCYAYIQKAA